jgi:AraC-like DNA-binding protein
MGIVFRADEEPVVSRIDRLRSVVGDTITPIDVRPAVDPARINDRLALHQAGAVRVVAAILTAAVAVRTPRLIRRSDPELCKFDIVTEGQLIVEQEDRQALLGPGDFAFVDFSRPARWITTGDCHGVAVTFPRSLLPLPDDDLGRLAAVRIPGNQGAGALVSTLARQMPRHLDDCTAADAVRLGTAMLDLFAAALAGGLDRPTPAPRSRARALLLNIHAYIERNLGDPALSPATIAAAHHVSLRYLYKLFETEQTTVADWIRRRRLEHCRRDLLNPSLRNLPISAIATRWGLTNPAHFNRLFRTTYNAPPGEYRQAHG